MSTSDNIYQIIRNRRAVRRYSDRSVATDLVSKLMDAASWSPSAHNRQPWRFAVLTDFEHKDKLAKAMGKRLYQDRVADGDRIDDIERDVNRSYGRITGAPVVIVVCLSMADMDSYLDTRRSEAEYMMAVQSVAMAAQNLWLMAHAEGLGACWLCAPLFAPELIHDVLELPKDWEAQGLLTIGWPAEEKSKTRRPWQEFVRFL